VLKMRYWHGRAEPMSLTAIARELGMSRGQEARNLERPRPRRHPTPSPVAWRAYLRGLIASEKNWSKLSKSTALKLPFPAPGPSGRSSGSRGHGAVSNRTAGRATRGQCRTEAEHLQGLPQ